jgi:D-serine deaminase-like pyridoxal phosphate-dependent protein
MLTSVVGRPIAELDTPALLIDLDIFERNIASMAADIASQGVQWRPHSKAHKCPAIAHKLIAAGAIGLTVAKLSEAEVYAAAGIKDMLIANQIVGPIKARRLAALCHHADVAVAVDNADNVRELDAAAGAAGSRPRVVVELNVGMNRAGVEIGQPTIEMAKLIAGCKHLRFAGLMAWEGHTMAMDEGDARQAEIVRAVQSLVDAAEQVRAAGLPVDIVSCGGTGTYLTSSAIKGVTEIEAGGGIFGDISYRDRAARVEQALTMMVGVTSRPTQTKVIFDAGRKSVDPTLRQPEPVGIATTGKHGFSAEHGTMTLAGPSDTPKVGDRMYLQIGYSDQCNHLHEYYFGIRKGIVETVWPIAARGKLQ